ncbi:UV-B-induced protein At3g17800, chloroplastic-like [Solanum dulcamara]|uniref:UV-B-induced protein At3g17800, chloroplastic-like n=1 Tax=Solanum dulcamara TaxID=45834 RepID=UPI0024851045|nr:UV-B-induced protein At3g17800, chloroplastic-like [Solanum dulcamara]
MDCGLSYTKISLHQSLPLTVKTLLSSSTCFAFNNSFFGSSSVSCRRSLFLVASGSSSSKCEFGGLNAPLEPTTPAGRLLITVLLNDRKYFHVAVQKQLEQLAYQRDEAVARMNLSLGSDEAFLHRRIAEVKELECEASVEDIMYMLISYKFSGIRVHLVPRLSKCMYNGRLEIWPCKDWELESIHSCEVLEMVREHLTTVLGWKEKSNVADNWTPTKVQKFQLCRVYVASVLYGYFLKSASLRHHLEQKLDHINPDRDIASSNQLLLSEIRSLGSEIVPFGRISGTRSTSLGQIPLLCEKKQDKLKYYVMSFDPETLQMCAKLKSKEALNLIEKHSYALFGDKKTGLVASDEVISTSLASLKRIVLEAIAFGSFLWDAEEYLRTVYKLKEN